jgi:hypothetical protein
VRRVLRRVRTAGEDHFAPSGSNLLLQPFEVSSPGPSTHYWTGSSTTPQTRCCHLGSGPGPRNGPDHRYLQRSGGQNSASRGANEVLQSGTEEEGLAARQLLCRFQIIRAIWNRPSCVDRTVADVIKRVRGDAVQVVLTSATQSADRARIVSVSRSGFKINKKGRQTNRSTRNLDPLAEDGAERTPTWVEIATGRRCRRQSD